MRHYSDTTPQEVKLGEYGAAPDCNGRGNRRTPKKPADQHSCLARFPRHRFERLVDINAIKLLRELVMGRYQPWLEVSNELGVVSENHGKPISRLLGQESKAAPPACETRSTAEEQSRDTMSGETGDPRENTVASGIVRHDYHMLISGNNPAENRTRFTLLGEMNPRNCRVSSERQHQKSTPPASKLGRYLHNAHDIGQCATWATTFVVGVADQEDVWRYVHPDVTKRRLVQPAVTTTKTSFTAIPAAIFGALGLPGGVCLEALKASLHFFAICLCYRNQVVAMLVAARNNYHLSPLFPSVSSSMLGHGDWVCATSEVALPYFLFVDETNIYFSENRRSFSHQWLVVNCCKVSWCLLTAVHSRCTQLQPVTTVESRETECFFTTHNEQARDPSNKPCSDTCRTAFRERAGQLASTHVVQMARVMSVASRTASTPPPQPTRDIYLNFSCLAAGRGGRFVLCFRCEQPGLLARMTQLSARRRGREALLSRPLDEQEGIFTPLAPSNTVSCNKTSFPLPETPAQ
ncbi:hypothetical protein PR048_012530 [Dryococelus australis]|uniref:Tc1-like transposase DDE domain-containing protein n=1 Tax=Dryococelus australis TaxID=614101 RepID=A0ABQ9HPM3_9NEOP|nr:hypothetical protein PR048_012530 [Dryococelus australis]